MKKLLALLLAISLLLSLSGCIWGTLTPREDIYDYVKNNQPKLQEVVSSDPQWIKDNYLTENFSRKVLGWNTIVEDIYVQEPGIVEFQCEGKGFAGGATYTGFYYSRTNIPSDMNWYDIRLTEIAPGVWEWKDDTSLNRIYTERIIDGWFYYIEEMP